MLGTKNAQSTAVQSPPSWVTSGYKELFRDADRLADRNYRPYTGGFTADQQAAFQNLRDAQGSSQPYFNAATGSYNTAGTALDKAGGYYNGAAGYYGAGSNLVNSGAGLIGQGTGYLGSSAGALGAAANALNAGYGAFGQSGNTLNSAAGAYGSALTPSYQRVNDYMNPYVQNVINATMANMQETNARQQQDVLGNAASRGALGGNRVGVAQAELARQQGLANNQTISGLWNDAYAQALGAANQQQQAELAGASGLTGVGQAQQGVGQGLLGIGSGFGNISSGYGNIASGYGNLGGGLIGAGQGLYGAGQGLAGIGQGLTGMGQTYAGIGQGQTQLGAQASDTNLAQIAAQLGAGTQQQQFDYQQYLNKLAFPYQKQSWLSGIYGGIGPNAGGTTVQQTPQGNILSQLIGLGLTGASLFADGGVVRPQYARGGGVMPYRNDNQEWPSASFDVSPYANDNSDTSFLSYIPEAGETPYTRASYPSIQDPQLEDPLDQAMGSAQRKGLGKVGGWIMPSMWGDDGGVAGAGGAAGGVYADGGVVRLMTKGRPQSTNIEDHRTPRDSIGELVESILESLSSNDNDLPPIPRKRANASYFPSEYDPLSPYRDPGAPADTFQARAHGGVVGHYGPGGIVPDDPYSIRRNNPFLGFLPKPPPLETAASTRAGSVYGGQMQPQPFSSPTDRAVKTVDVDRFGNIKAPSPPLNSGANNLGVQGTKHPRGYQVPAYNSLNEPWPGEYDRTLSPGTYRSNGDIIQNKPVGLMGGVVNARDVMLDQSNLGLTSPGVQPKREPIDITVHGGNTYRPSFADRTWADVAPSKPMVWEDVQTSGVVPEGDPWRGTRIDAQTLNGTAPTAGLVTGRAHSRKSQFFQPVQKAAPKPIKHSFAPVKSANERFTQLGQDMAFMPKSVQTSDRWNTGYAFGGAVRDGYAPGGVIGDVPYTVGDQFVTEPAPGYSSNVGEAFQSLRDGNGLNLAPDFKQALLAAGAGMMASRSPFALQGVGEGTLKGVNAWNERQQLERENALARASIANQTKQTDISQQLANAQVPLMNAQTQQARYVTQWSPLGLKVIDLFNVSEPKLYKWGSVGPDGQLITPPAGGAADNSGFQPLFYEPGGSAASGGPDDNRLLVEEAVPTVYKEAGDAMTDATGRYNSAQGAQGQLTQMRDALARLPEDGFLTPGTNFEERTSFAKGVNTMARILGLNPLIDQSEVAAGEEVTKVAKRLGFELTNTFQNSGAAQIVESAVSAVPSGENSPEGAQVIINTLEAFNKRAIDWKEFLNDYVQNHAGSSLGADVAFNRAYPPELYAISAYVPDGAFQLLRQHPDQATIDAFNAKYGHGRDIAKYVLINAQGAQGG